MSRVSSICVVIAAMTVSACGLIDGGLFDPPPEVKQAALLRCDLAQFMPSCIDPGSEASLPAWERAQISQAEVDCVDALGCDENEVDGEATNAAVVECLNSDSRPGETPSDEEFQALIECLLDCDSQYETAVCTNGDELGAATDDREVCRDAC
jgi:hypothetical protein